MAYGLPYIGSKNLIARELLQQMPRRDYFVDLFAGGGAMWQAAAESGKYSRYLVNEYNEQQCDFLRDCADGIYNERNEWVTRDEFMQHSIESAFLRCVWSFGNTADSYLCASVLEDWERALFHAYEFNDYKIFKEIGFAGDTVYLEDIKRKPDLYKRKYMEYKFKNVIEIEERITKKKHKDDDTKERFACILKGAANFHGLTGKAINEYLGNDMWGHYTANPRSQFVYPTAENYERLREIMPTLQPFDELQVPCFCNEERDFIILSEKENWHVCVPQKRINRLRAFHKQCERMDIVRKTDFSSKSYDEVEIPENSLIYCDPPYINTTGYGVQFDHSRFYDWCRAQKELVIISEYTMPDDFIPIWQKNKRVTLCSGGAKKAEEKLFIHKSQMPLLYKRNGGYQTKLWL